MNRSMHCSIEKSNQVGYPRAEPAEAAKWAVAYCTQKTTQTPGSQLLYDDFITGLEFHQNNTHISVSGTIDAKVFF